MRQPAAVEVAAGVVADGAAELGLEPVRRLLHPAVQVLAAAVLLGLAGIGRGQGHARLGGELLDGFAERKPLGLLQEGDDVAVLAG